MPLAARSVCRRLMGVRRPCWIAAVGSISDRRAESLKDIKQHADAAAYQRTGFRIPVDAPDTGTNRSAGGCCTCRQRQYSDDYDKSNDVAFHMAISRIVCSF